MAGPGRAAIKRLERPENLSSRTYSDLKWLIISCQLQPGAPLNEAEIAREFGTSRSPLREALRRLEQERFILDEGERYKRVAPIRSEDVLQLYEMRAVLESFAADRAEGRISTAVVDQFEVDFAVIAEELERGRVEVFNRSDFAFHQIFISRCGNDRIIEQLSKLEDQLTRIWNYVGPRVGHTKLALAEHVEIIGAIRSPAPHSLADAVRRHILSVGHRVASFVSEMQRDAGT
ncbi:MAG TPA: GntR family transcriptional regulator [Bauldia sp.]|nr:GntR family transcriptional regulator [Bauldia sp.]